MKRLSFFASAICLIFFSGCAGNLNTDVFIPKGVKLAEIEVHEIRICKEEILNENGNAISKLSLLKGDVPYSDVFYHEFLCINSEPPHEKYSIPASDWYENYDHLYYRAHYETLKLKIEEIKNICSISNQLSIKCKKIKQALNEMNQYEYKERK